MITLMIKLLEILHREFVYLWYYFDLQFRQIFWFWVLGILFGSAVSVFAKNSIHTLAEKAGRKIPGLFSLIFASALGIASPLCMYGTIPICAAFSRKGLRDDFLAAFMMSSVLLNPQLIVYSAALGPALFWIRIISCFLCGILAGLFVRLFFHRKIVVAAKNEESTKSSFFNFSGFEEPCSRDTDPNIFLRFVKNIWRNIRATALWFLLGIVLSALFQRYVPQEAIGKLFGKNEGFGILLAAGAGVPLYVCGGGTVPLIIQWRADGMSAGSAAAFMLTGPATKITNLGALKIVMGIRNFCLYLAFVMIFSLLTGVLVNLLI